MNSLTLLPGFVNVSGLWLVACRCESEGEECPCNGKATGAESEPLIQSTGENASEPVAVQQAVANWFSKARSECADNYECASESGGQCSAVLPGGGGGGGPSVENGGCGCKQKKDFPNPLPNPMPHTNPSRDQRATPIRPDIA